MKQYLFIKKIVIFTLFSLSFSVNAGIIEFEAFEIRNSNSTTTAPWDGNMSIVENVAGDGFSAATPDGGQKVGYGTNAFDNMQINLFETVNFDKISGKNGVVPYLNMWVTDGTNYAVISSENDYRGDDFQTRQEWKIFEYTPGGFDWLFDSGLGSRTASQYLQLNNVSVTLADFADGITLYGGPGIGATGVGTGAPQGGYGFNVIFGDTQSNYTGSYALEKLVVNYDQKTYVAGNTTDVPEPSTIAIFALGMIGFASRQFKKHN
jgi:hypothetical protein